MFKKKQQQQYFIKVLELLDPSKKKKGNFNLHKT